MGCEGIGSGSFQARNTLPAPRAYYAPLNRWEQKAPSIFDQAEDILTGCVCVCCLHACCFSSDTVGAGSGPNWEWAADSAGNGAFIYLHCSAPPHPLSLSLSLHHAEHILKKEKGGGWDRHFKIKSRFVPCVVVQRRVGYHVSYGLTTRVTEQMESKRLTDE